MPETNVQVGAKPNGSVYRGRERRSPENADLRRFVEARLIAYRRIEEIKVEEAKAKESSKPVSLLDW